MPTATAPGAPGAALARRAPQAFGCPAGKHGQLLGDKSSLWLLKPHVQVTDSVSRSAVTGLRRWAPRLLFVTSGASPQARPGPADRSPLPEAAELRRERGGRGGAAGQLRAAGGGCRAGGMRGWDRQPGTTHRCQPPFLRERCSLTSDVCLGFCSVKNSFTQQLTCRGWRLAVGCAREAFSGTINYSLRPRIFDLRTQINYSSMQETGSQSSKPSILLPETHEKGKFLCSLAVTERRYQG